MKIIVFLFILFKVSASDTCPENLSEISKTIERINTSKFNNIRNLKDYRSFFGDSFINFLSEKKDLSWLDLGSGIALSSIDYLKQYPERHHTRVVAINASKKPEIQPQQYLEIKKKKLLNIIKKFYKTHSEMKDIYFLQDEISLVESLIFEYKTFRDKRFDFFKGKFFNEISDESLGKFDIITDVFGVLNYTDNFSRDLERALSLLNQNGKLYFTFVNTNITSENGALFGLDRYLQEVEGIKFSSTLVNKITEVFTIEKLLPSIVLKRLYLQKFTDLNPPVRSYMLKD